MTALVEQIRATTPFGVLKDDTFPVPGIQLHDAAGDVIDPAGLTVTLKRWSPAGIETEMPGTITGNDISFPWLTDDTIAETKWQTMVHLDDGVDLQYSLSAPMLYVYDTATMWCSVADVEVIVGPGYSQYEILAAIEVAESVVRTRVTLEAGSPVPPRVRQATAILAARVLTTDVEGGSGGGIIEERIADYSVRYSEGQGGSVWGFDGIIGDLLAPWLKTKVYSMNIAEPRASTSEDDEEVYTP